MIDPFQMSGVVHMKRHGSDRTGAREGRVARSDNHFGKPDRRTIPVSLLISATDPHHSYLI